VVGKIGLLICRIAKLFLLMRLKGSMSADEREINNIGLASDHQVFFSARPGAEENSRHSERNIRGNCTPTAKNWVA